MELFRFSDDMVEHLSVCCIRTNQSAQADLYTNRLVFFCHIFCVCWHTHYMICSAHFLFLCISLFSFSAWYGLGIQTTSMKGNQIKRSQKWKCHICCVDVSVCACIGKSKSVGQMFPLTDQCGTKWSLFKVEFFFGWSRLSTLCVHVVWSFREGLLALMFMCIPGSLSIHWWCSGYSAFIISFDTNSGMWECESFWLHWSGALVLCNNLIGSNRLEFKSD